MDNMDNKTKIFYIVESITGSKGNGIAQQALTWSRILSKYTDIKTILVNSWDEYTYQEGDVVHLFGSSGVWFYDVANRMKEKGCKVVWSPICDNVDSPKIQRMKTFIGNKRLQLFSYPMIRKQTYDIVDKVFVRSRYEMEYLKSAYGIGDSQMVVVPLSMSYEDNIQIFSASRENFCLHISSISQERKNVLRLVKASKKYNFRLILAGNKGSDTEYQRIGKEIIGARNIEVLGYISEEKKRELYQKAKVFALPSIKEGVGIVALDAAHYGCEIVITNQGGPKEYFGDLSYQVDPYDIDNIGKSIILAMEGTNQPELSEWVNKHYSQPVIASCLAKAYHELIK